MFAKAVVFKGFLVGALLCTQLVSAAPASKYDLRGISLGMSTEDVLAAAKAQDMVVTSNSPNNGNRPSPFQIILLQDKTVKHRSQGDDSNSGGGLALTIRVSTATKKTVWIEAAQLGPGDLLQAAKGKWGAGKAASYDCTTNMRYGAAVYHWGECAGPHVEYYSRGTNTFSGTDVLLIVDPQGLKVPTAAVPVPRL